MALYKRKIKIINSKPPKIKHKNEERNVNNTEKENIQYENIKTGNSSRFFINPSFFDHLDTQILDSFEHETNSIILGYKRFKIIEKVLNNELNNEIRFRVKDVGLNTEEMIVLKGEWSHSLIKNGDFAHFIGTKDQETGIYVVSDSENLFILHPDCLISGSSLSSSFPCIRKTVLNTNVSCYRTIDKGDRDQCHIKQHFDKRTAHLNKENIQYFVHWNRLLDLESRSVIRSQKEIWTLSSSEREELGRCFGHMKIQNTEINEDKTVYTFVKNSESKEKMINLSSSTISVSDRVVLSSECGKIALITGIITFLTSKMVQVSCRSSIKKSHKSFLNKEFRIDADEFTSFIPILRGNIAHLFVYQEHDIRKRLRKIISETISPSFNRTIQFPKISDKLLTEYNLLNNDQQNCVKRALETEDYLLILGMPGTGKSTTIVFLVQLLAELKYKILITSYTHSAVDNILLKLLKKDVDFLRIGRLNQINKKLYSKSLENISCSSTVDLETVINSKNIFATTCLSINNAIFSQMEFDFCIVDEASQITEPACLGPLNYSKRFILVGDHFQLPPLVKSTTAKEEGLDISLFKRLAEAHPKTVVHLSYQYRMNADILSLCNSVIYDKKLKCGSSLVAQSALNLPFWDNFIQFISLKKQNKEILILKEILDPKSRVIFLNTQNLPAYETQTGHRNGVRIQNKFECEIISQIVHLFVRLGLSMDSIGIISQYRSQIKIISESLLRFSDILINTVDKFQGKDKNLIIMSFVRSNEMSTIGELLSDKRRINVAITRAKKKFIMIGNRKTLMKNSVFKHLFDVLEKKNWVKDLPFGYNAQFCAFSNDILVEK